MNDTVRLLRDHHPVDLTMQGEVIARAARIFVTTDRVLVWQMDEQRNPVLTHQLGLAQDHGIQPNRGSLTGPLELTLDNGLVVYANRALGCGCGSSLKVLDRPVDF